MIKNLIKDKNVLIISVFLLFAVAVQAVGNEIDRYKDIKNEKNTPKLNTQPSCSS